MKIAVFGASGRIGSRIVNEALSRGHNVTAVVRHPETYTGGNRPHLYVAKGDVFNSDHVESCAFDHDAVVSAYSNTGGATPGSIAEVALPLINGLKQANVTRLIVVGGAGSLEVSPGVQLVDAPDFPEAYKAISLAHRDALKIYQQEKELEWTSVSPSEVIYPGERTGKYRIGTNQLLKDEHGKSHISMEDFAAGILDEIENPQHIRQQMTVGY
ncbi:NAD(P)-dependent oxidoreductase [Mucilaginibacter agri]|uniref:NAD(P)H-binding protein n=1 Tax=Mucilaginibacter agri TaxID=2695265 RepID=A0A965ZIM0_9SPHI|nr:NAD(P)-dependent oxidoreductase [Mucilaginibacter agri]NCD71760.1 NAD(P)H-binding protein [Mucilaginibacter agri]